MVLIKTRPKFKGCFGDFSSKSKQTKSYENNLIKPRVTRIKKYAIQLPYVLFEASEKKLRVQFEIHIYIYFSSFSYFILKKYYEKTFWNKLIFIIRIKGIRRIE